MHRRRAILVLSCLLFVPVAASCGGERNKAAPLSVGEPGSPPALAPPALPAATMTAPAAPPPITVTGRIVAFPTLFRAQDITADTDGHLWFTTNLALLGRVEPADGSVTFVPLPTAAFAIAPGVDGSLWFSTASGVGRLSSYGLDEEFTLAELGSPIDIASDRDGNVWALGFAQIARVTTDGAVTLFPLPTPLSSSGEHIASGPDGNLWYTRSPGFIGRITQEGVGTEFPVMGTGGLFGIAGGNDGAVWFTRSGGGAGDNAIDRITATGNASRVVQLPTSQTMIPDPPDNMPLAITAGPDGNMYYTTYFVQPTTYIGAVTPSGVLTRYEIPALVASFAIAAGPDGNLWFTDVFNDRIWRLTPLP